MWKIQPRVLNVPVTFVSGSVCCSSALCLYHYFCKTMTASAPASQTSRIPQASARHPMTQQPNQLQVCYTHKPRSADRHLNEPLLLRPQANVNKSASHSRRSSPPSRNSTQTKAWCPSPSPHLPTPQIRDIGKCLCFDLRLSRKPLWEDVQSHLPLDSLQ